MKFLSKFIAPVLIGALALTLFIAPSVLSQTITLPGFTPATALTGAELVWGDQPGNTTGPTGPTVKISLAQILTYIQSNIGGGGGGGGGITLFNGRTGPSITLSAADVINALGFTPLSSTAGSALLTTANVWTAQQTFAGGVNIAQRDVSSSVTLALSDGSVCGDIRGGSINLTLPNNPIPNGHTISVDDCWYKATASNTVTVSAAAGQHVGNVQTSIVITTAGGSVNFVWSQNRQNWDLF